MLAMLRDAGQRTRLRDAGIARAGKFHWRDTARRTREVYAAALD